MASASGKPGGSQGKKMTKPTASMKAKTPAKALLSKELVGDSDDEDAAPADRSTKAVVTQSATKPRPKKPETIPAKVNGVKRKSDQQSSSDESEDDDSSEDGSEQKIFGVKAKKAKIARGRHTETEEETSSEEDEDVPDVDLRPIGATQTPKLREIAQLSTSTSQPVEPYKPPSGYIALDPRALRCPALASSDLEGKQLWHISAPVGVPLASITEIALHSIKANTIVLHENDTDYTWHEDPTSIDDIVFLPSEHGYALAQQRIEKRLHLRQQVTLPHLTKRQARQDTGNAAAADIAQASVSNIRPQPKGLRMRYKPPGFGNGKPGVVGFDSESEGPGNDESTLQFPKTMGGASEEHRDSATKSSKKKSKKGKEADARVNGTPKVNGLGNVPYEEGPSGPLTKTVVTRTVTPDDEDSVMANGTDLEKLGKEARAKRKEAKRLKREAKRTEKEARKEHAGPA